MDARKTVQSILAVGFAYGIVSLFVVTAWTWCARTEPASDVLDGVAPSGERYCSRFSSIVRLVDGQAIAPFVKRRLLPDLTRLLVRCTPDAMWSALARRIDGEGRLAEWTRGQLRRLNWKPAHYPVLFTATFLIWCSAFGFMWACRWLVRIVYHTPGWLADVLGGVLGFALLGGNGDWHYLGYPYDFPNAFVFTLALAALLARRRWFVLAFTAAVYSKETSVLLILAYFLMSTPRRTPRFWAMLALLTTIYAAIRGWIEMRYPVLEGDFWSLQRNGKYLALRFFYMWWLPFLGVSVIRLLSLWRQYPAPLRRLCLLAVPLFGIAIFKGWIEEMRQYLEMLPIAGIIVIHWILHEAGFGHLLQARQSNSVSSATDLFVPPQLPTDATEGASSMAA
jgi:hypothetical protein